MDSAGDLEIRGRGLPDHNPGRLASTQELQENNAIRRPRPDLIIPREIMIAVGTSQTRLVPLDEYISFQVMAFSKTAVAPPMIAPLAWEVGSE